MLAMWFGSLPKWDSCIHSGMACGSLGEAWQGEVEARGHSGGQGGGYGIAQGQAVVRSQPATCRVMYAARMAVLFLR